MAKGVNKVILIGNLGKDPEVRTLQSGSACNFTIATSESWKDKTTGQQQERTEWHRISVFGKLAEICGQYLKKGSKVYIEGSLRTRKWQNKEGVDQYTTEIIADQMQMLDGRGQGGGMDDAGGYTGASQPQARTQNTSSANNEAQPASYEAFDDDIPF